MSSAALNFVEDVAMELAGAKSLQRLGKKYIKPSMRHKLTRIAGKYKLGKTPKKSGKSYSQRVKAIGHDKHVDNAQRHEISNEALTAKNDQTLYKTELTDVPGAASTVAIDRRRRDMMYFSGARICMEMRNNSADPMYFNVAVIAPRGNQLGVFSTNFFRANDTDRATNASAAELKGLEWHCLPINADQFTILRHDKFLLGPNVEPSSSDYKDNTTPNYMNYDKYVPVKRNVRFDPQENCTDPVYLVYWAAKFGSSATAATSGAISVSEHCITYFKEPTRCC